MEIFQLNLKGEFMWSKTESTGDRALFMSANKSPVTRFRCFEHGLVEDCIYFDSPHLFFLGTSRR